MLLCVKYVCVVFNEHNRKNKCLCNKVFIKISNKSKL